MKKEQNMDRCAHVCELISSRDIQIPRRGLAASRRMQPPIILA